MSPARGGLPSPLSPKAGFYFFPHPTLQSVLTCLLTVSPHQTVRAGASSVSLLLYSLRPAQCLPQMSGVLQKCYGREESVSEPASLVCGTCSRDGRCSYEGMAHQSSCVTHNNTVGTDKVLSCYIFGFFFAHKAFNTALVPD